VRYPPLVSYKNEAEYRIHYETIYCQGQLKTFDNVFVRFRKRNFNHCFYRSTYRNGVKDAFDRKRAERIDWIKTTLEDPDAELHEGWDKRTKSYDSSRRVALVKGNYLVVIQFTGTSKADFVTAYLVDSEDSLQKIKKSPVYKKETADSPGGLSG